MVKPVYLITIGLLLGVGAWLGVKRLSVPGEVAVVGISPERRPGAQMCTQIAGTCKGAGGQCISYTDGCQMSKYCATPLESCSGAVASPTPANCHYEQVQCIKAPCNPVLVCDSPNPRKCIKFGHRSWCVPTR